MSTRCLCTILAFLASVALAYGKGPPDLILITGGGLTQPIQITDSTLLKPFNPWGQHFVDWKPEPLADVPCARRSFSVKFYVKWQGEKPSENHDDFMMFYAGRYCSSGATGYMRNLADGKWRPTTSEWDSLITNLVAAQDPQRGPDMIMIAGGELKRPIEIIDPELLRTFDPWEGAFVDWNKPAAVGHCSWEYEIFYYKKEANDLPPTPYDRGDLRMIYGLRYCLDADGGPGYTHLADENDRFGPENMQNVYDGRDRGKWHPSTAVWNRFIRDEIAAQKSITAHLH